MEGRHQRDGVIFMKRPAKATDRFFAAEQGLGGECPERYNRFGRDCLNLAEQKRAAVRNFLQSRIPVFRRAAFEDIADIDLIALIPHRLDHPGQQLAGFTDKRLPLEVFIPAWRLADKDNFCTLTSAAEDNIFSACAEGATLAVA